MRGIAAASGGEMTLSLRMCALGAGLAVLSTLAGAQASGGRIAIESGATLARVNVTTQLVRWRGRRAVRVEPVPVASEAAPTMVLLPAITFTHGVIDIDVAATVAATADSSVARGFVGLAFHVQPDTQRYQTIFVRPTNGRAQQQLRRNRATQYTAEPEWPWHRLRREFPGVYESYVDLVPGAWTHLRIVVSPDGARLFVNGAAQPALVVTEPRTDLQDGRLALWVGYGTVAHFANLRVRHTSSP